jgi:hypothetical protein
MTVAAEHDADTDAAEAEDTPAPVAPDRSGAVVRARAQADAYESVFSQHELDLGNGQKLTVPPHPNLRMLDDDAQAEYEKLLFEANNTYDRHPDIYIPEQKLDNGIVIPAETKRGALIVPYQRTGSDGKPELITPPHSVKVVQIALGEKDYARLRAAKKSAADVWRIWNQQGIDVAARETFRPVPSAGASNVETVSG